jgi:tetratricopeptide (TPR) repeat protein
MRNAYAWVGSLRLARLVGGATVGILLIASPFSPLKAQDASPPAKAAAKPKAAKAKKPTAPGNPDAADQASAAKDPTLATQSYSTGVIAYQAGKYDAAVTAMNAAVQSGALPSHLLAKALYHRGASFQQLGKPGQAISDLTSALWLKGGLDDDERSDATKLRASAYRDAGLPEQGQVAAVVPSPGTPAPTATSMIPATGLFSSPATSSASANPVPTASLNESTPTTSSSVGLGNVFGNLFGGGATPASVPERQHSVTAVALSSPPAATPSSAEVLPWANAGPQNGPTGAVSVPVVNVAKPTASLDMAVAAKAVPSPLKKVAAVGRPGGSIKIQVAAVKSRDEASSIISKIQAAGGSLASAPSTVDETTFGSMGTFYRVRLGPYPTAAAAKPDCDALKVNGLDCLISAK